MGAPAGCVVHGYRKEVSRRRVYADDAKQTASDLGCY